MELIDGFFYTLVLLALVQGLISLKNGIKNHKYSMNYLSPAAPDRPTVVFCPVRGSDSNLEATVASLLDQSHSQYRVVFIVDSEQDAAVEVLSGSIGAGGRGEWVVAGAAVNMGQKVHSLLHAVRSRVEGEEVLVFCDADAWYGPDWLRQLVAPLENESAGATTGYRWYVPPASDLPSTFRSAWNASVAGFLGPHNNNFAWGGSTAIRREVFETAAVMECWQGALSDDYVLTEAVRALGLQVVYVPTCLVPSYQTCRWDELIEFTTRQIQITRVYAPRVWLLGLVSYTLFNFTFVWVTLAVVESLAVLPLWFSLYGLAAVRADLRVRAAARTIDEAALYQNRWFYRLSPPLIALLYEWNFVVSILSRRIEWKGIRYRLVSRHETVIEP